MVVKTLFHQWAKCLFVSSALGMAAPVALADTTLVGETAGLGSAPHQIMIYLAKASDSEDVAQIQIAAGQTLTNALMNLATKRADIASAPFNLPFLMSRAAGPYAHLDKESAASMAKDLRVLYTYGLGIHGLYAYESAKVQGWDDLSGRTVLNGPPRGSALTIARILAEQVGGVKEEQDFRGLQMNWGQMPQAISSGSADAMLLPIYFPGKRLTQALSSGDLVLWSMPIDKWNSEIMQRFMRSPGLAPFSENLSSFPTLSGLRIVSEDDTFRSLKSLGGDMVHKDMAYETAYNLTRVMIAGMDDLQRRSAILRFANMKTVDPATTGMCGIYTLKYHLGAIAAWEEAGYVVPDCAKPAD